MKIINIFLKHLAKVQIKYRNIILISTLIITLILLAGIPNIKMQTDMMEEMPQDLSIFILNDKITDTYGGNDVIVIITQINNLKDDQNGIKDIRDPKTITFIQELETKLMRESNINSVISINTYLQGSELSNKEDIKNFLKIVPDASAFFSKDFTSNIMYVTADVGSSNDKINDLVETIEKNIDLTTKVPGTKNYITGGPIINATIGGLMVGDALLSISVALLVIFLLLIILKRSLIKSVIILIPLAIGLIWTMGILGYANIPITIATAGLGAMILGLGVEYSIFVLTRYLEERDKGLSQEDALRISIPAVGQATTGSGLTTLVGFLALTLSVIPMLQKLGLTLAIGIASVLIASLVISPTIFTVIEKWHIKSLSKKRKNKFTNK